jgi:hypothetical protein
VWIASLALAARASDCPVIDVAEAVAGGPVAGNCAQATVDLPDLQEARALGRAREVLLAHGWTFRWEDAERDVIVGHVSAAPSEVWQRADRWLRVWHLPEEAAAPGRSGATGTRLEFVDVTGEDPRPPPRERRDWDPLAGLPVFGSVEGGPPRTPIRAVCRVWSEETNVDGPARAALAAAFEEALATPWPAIRWIDESAPGTDERAVPAGCDAVLALHAQVVARGVIGGLDAELYTSDQVRLRASIASGMLAPAEDGAALARELLRLLAPDPVDAAAALAAAPPAPPSPLGRWDDASGPVTVVRTDDALTVVLPDADPAPALIRRLDADFAPVGVAVAPVPAGAGIVLVRSGRDGYLLEPFVAELSASGPAAWRVFAAPPWSLPRCARDVAVDGSRITATCRGAPLTWTVSGLLGLRDRVAAPAEQPAAPPPPPAPPTPPRPVAVATVVGADAGTLDVVQWFQGSVRWDGSAVLVVFFETWDPLGREAMPALEAQYEAYHPRGLEMVALNRLTHSTAPDVAAYITQFGLTFPVAQETGALRERYLVTGIPAAALLAGGKVVWRGHPRELTDAVIEAALGPR